MPVYELFVTREWSVNRRPVGWAAVAGVAIVPPVKPNEQAPGGCGWVVVLSTLF